MMTPNVVFNIMKQKCFDQLNFLIIFDINQANMTEVMLTVY